MTVNADAAIADAPPRLAWFSPLRPERSGIAAYTAELLPYLERAWRIDTFDSSRAHEFAWRARRAPYELVVYQLGNAPCHDFMWGHLAVYPGLVVLHDARLHHARARQLLAANRDGDYRREFQFDHPDVHPDAAEYAVRAMGGPVQYLWPMRRLVLRVAKLIAVHNPRVADELRREEPDARVDVIRMGVPAIAPSEDARQRIRARHGISATAVVFAAFGKMTDEKRIGPIVRTFLSLVADGIDAHLLLIGEDEGFAGRLAAEDGGRVHVAGYVDDSDVAACLLASDVCLCLRWPTALETSASWLRCLAAARATVVSDLAHTADVPVSVARRVDLLDEDRSLAGAVRDLAVDTSGRHRLARAGHAWWAAHHTMTMMADDYRRVIEKAVAAPTPARRDLPSHVLDDHTAFAGSILGRYGAALGWFDV